MVNCNCSAYPFPHRPGGGKCLYKQVYDYLHDRYSFDVSVAVFQGYTGDFDRVVRDIVADCDLTTSKAYYQREYADMME